MSRKLSIRLLGILCALGAQAAWAEGEIQLQVGESRVVECAAPRRAVVGNPSVVELGRIGDKDLLLTGKSPGSTHLMYEDASGSRVQTGVTVSPGRLKSSLVEVGVEILEVDSQSALKAGLNWGSLSDTKSLQDSLTVAEIDPPPVRKIGPLERGAVAASLQMLLDKGKAKVLAKPRLMVASGEEASFLAGGEVPYVASDKNGSANVQFKPYGVKLNVRPETSSDGSLRTKVRAEVSGLDYQNGVSAAGSAVPALKTRWAETTVQMRPGSTLVLAGLIQDELQTLHSGIPLLSEIPILGALFRTTHEDHRQTELVIFLTPNLVGTQAN